MKVREDFTIMEKAPPPRAQFLNVKARTFVLSSGVLYLNNMFLLHFMTHKINLVVFGAWFTFFMFSSIIPISIYGWK